MIRSALLLAILLAAEGAHAQAPANASPEQEDVLAVVDRFMEAVSSGDTRTLAALQLDGTLTTATSVGPDGRPRLNRRGLQADALPPGLRERYWDPTVLIRRDIAVVWAPYEFWRDGKTTHCGVDVFDLVKQDGAWKMAHIMYTVEPDACPELRPSDPSRVRPSRR